MRYSTGTGQGQKWELAKSANKNIHFGKHDSVDEHLKILEEQINYWEFGQECQSDSLKRIRIFFIIFSPSFFKIVLSHYMIYLIRR